MATACNSCGYKSNEVKSGTGVSELGTQIKLKITDPSDLSRDVLKVCVYKVLVLQGNAVILQNMAGRNSSSLYTGVGV